jgi:YHS domain-containing protein
LVALVAVALLAGAVLGPQPVYAGGVVNSSLLGGVAIEGTDPVAYFEDGEPALGSSEFEHEWLGATWRFASAENRDRFAAEPEKYAPQYGGYCAWAVSQGYTAKIDPAAW